MSDGNGEQFNLIQEILIVCLTGGFIGVAVLTILISIVEWLKQTPTL